ncbi:3-(3-hydroxy-phenyl)propionate transporter MhpT [Halomonas binhaiensis]|uniref:3-(3-hydroxy-phenyl)propionate transporter MhpT n=1 Tax=Halomonas binhaiensis TaxID=2562282 RepID=A0A5C1NC64_9GAMM|nr:3-(3-hydroxy-phenyl)propionate transporter MhpT [Halomonas binhaiensis]QEM80253.1 3-(3-hydroxy-phenyl)propionate transporter MhpT [Halomonas binhaiensis]
MPTKNITGTTQQASATPARTWVTIALCFMVALLEGWDLQAPGIAAQGMTAVFGLDQMAIGWVFSIGIFGLLPGALMGGRLADKFGRKILLIMAVAIFGLFSVATVYAWNLSTLLIARLLTGIGLGMALPNLIALTSEAVGERMRGFAVSLMYCGVPLGAALAATVGIAGFEETWKIVFIVGGITPLMIIPMLAFYLPESAAFQSQRNQSGQSEASATAWRNLFSDGMAAPTLMLWSSYFFTLFVVYMLINWLPSLLVEQGMTSADASWVMFSFQIGAVVGTLALGALIGRLPAMALAVLIYLGIFSALIALALAGQLTSMMTAGFMVGLFATGGQCVLYALAPMFYHTRLRATGVGTAVAVGRLGAMGGPLVAGQMLAVGAGTVGVMVATGPGILIAGCAVFKLLKGISPTGTEGNQEAFSTISANGKG